MFSGVAIGRSASPASTPNSVVVAPERGRVGGGWDGRIRRLLQGKSIIYIHGAMVHPQIAPVHLILVRNSHVQTVVHAGAAVLVVRGQHRTVEMHSRAL